MLHYKTIESGTLQLLKELQSNPVLQDMRLVGGTGLALQLGHRKSIDLDLFGLINVPSEDLRESLMTGHSFQVIKESANIHIYLIDGVKVDLVNYSYQWIDSPLQDNGITIASINDIAAMKITAIIGRGTKKDFIDLYYILKHLSLSEILDLYMQKYPEGSVFMAIKSLSFFEDAEADPMPLMYEDVSWDQIKESILQTIEEYCRHQQR